MKLTKCEQCGGPTAEGLPLCPDCMRATGAAADQIDAAEELPKSFVLTQEFGAQRVYLTKYNAAVLTRRFETARERAAYPFGKEYTE